MNAPWSSSQRANGSANREPFSAFLCDDLSIETTKALMPEFNWTADKIFKGGMRNAIQTLSVSSSPQILLVDLSEADDPLADINSLAEVCEPGTVVLTMGKINDVGFYRDLLASGIHDYLLKPISSDQLRETLLAAQAALFTPKQTNEQESAQKHVVHVVGARGGVGVSMVATSLAQLFAKEQNIKTALLDLDIQFGIGALSFDLEPGRGLTDALESPNRIDSLLIERAMVRDHDNLAILSAEAPINSPLFADPSAYIQLQNELRHNFDALIVDIPRHLAVQNPGLLTESTHVYLVTDLTLAATRDTIRMLAFLKHAAPNADVVVVANKFTGNSDVEVSRKDFEVSIERPVQVVIPLDVKSAITASKQGRPFIEAAKGSKAAAALGELTKRAVTATETADEQDTADAKAGLKSTFQMLKSKLAKKK
jgi:pilus assembly protein CpaE